MKLNSDQKRAATYQGEAQNILVTAGAGCGKTRTIIARAIYLVNSGTDASRILMMTFTNRAAREMKSRLRSELGAISNKIQAGTFHSFCLKVIRKLPNSFGISGLNIIDSDDQISLMTIIRGRYVSKNKNQLNKEFPKPSELINYYSFSRNTCKSPKKYLSTNTDLSIDYIEMCLSVFDDYQREKEKRGYLDYDDLLMHFTNLLEEKPKLRKAVTGLFDEVLVDEMQDTNPLQFSILKHFSSENVRLFCVGDPAQSIYRFRGAEFKHVYEFDKIFGDSEIINLSLNYRSYQEILNLSNWLLKRSPLDYRNKLEASRGNGGYLPSICDFDSPKDEASFIADKILERRENDVNYKDIMVLVRSGFDAKPIEAEFISRKIPYYFVGGTSLTKSAHVRDVLSLLRIVRNQQDDLAWMRFLQLWPRIGKKTAENIIESFYTKSKKNPLDILANNIGTANGAIKSYEVVYSSRDTPRVCVANAVKSLKSTLKEKYEKWSNRYQDLKLLITVSERYKTIGDFIDAFTLEPMTNTEIDKMEIEDAVLLITVHSAKGTEAPICFVANAKQGTYPHSRSYGEIESEEEERRVLYVALTRAKNELFITRSKNQNSGFYVENIPTEGEEYFLAEVPDKLINKEIHGFNPDYSSGLWSLKDEY